MVCLPLTYVIVGSMASELLKPARTITLERKSNSRLGEKVCVQSSANEWLKDTSQCFLSSRLTGSD
jgi:hypothetical protein